MAEGRKFTTGAARLAVAAVVAVALAAGIYVTLGKERNGAVSAMCAPSKPLAASLEPLVRGEVAAFQIADRPADLSTLAFTDPTGAATTLASFNGKVALLNLWATWCGPCRQEMPALDRLESALGGPGFSVVPVSIDIGDPDRPQEFLTSVGVKKLPLYTDRSTEIFDALKKRGLAIGLPVTVLVDRNGCTLGHINGPAAWDGDEGKRLIEAAVKATPTS